MLHLQEVIFEDAVVLRATSSASPLQKQNPFKPKNEDPDKDALSECERPSQ